MKKIKIIILFILCGLFCAANSNAQTPNSGTTGDCIWTFTGTSGNYTLTISGEGEMENYMDFSAQPWASIRYAITKVVIGEGVTNIGIGAFANCSSLTAVTIPNSVTRIGDLAFFYCSSLTTVTVQWNNPLAINGSVFLGCEINAVMLIMPQGTVEAYYSADVWMDFYFEGISAPITGACGDNLTWIYNIASGTLTISGTGEMVNYISVGWQPWWYYRNSIIKIVIGAGVTNIGNYAFFECRNLTEVNIPNSVTTIGNNVFNDCSNLTSITIPNSVTTIGNGTFANCRSLTEVNIPNSVTTLGEIIFRNCINLTAINVATDNNQYSSIDGVLFNKNQTTLIQYPGGKQGGYTIPNSVTTIVNYAFFYCNLTEVTIPNSVTTIGENVFTGCQSLNAITIPNSITTIGDNAFYDCRSLTSITIPNSVTTIGDRAFYNCISLTAVTIPNLLTSIGERAFAGCRSLTAVTIPNSTTTIGDYAFYYCISLTTVTVQWTNPLAINSNVFFDCGTNAVKLIVPQGTVEVYASADVWNDFYIEGISAPTITGACGDNLTWIYNIVNGTLAISGTGEMYNYSSTHSPWYNFRAKIRTLILPDGISTIGNWAFYICISLTEITIPNSVTSIGEMAFYNCIGLTEVTIPNLVTTIGNDVFSFCSNLTSVIIPASVTGIGNNAFRGCSGLVQIINNAISPQPFNNNSGTFDEVDKNVCVLIVPDGSVGLYRAANEWKKFYFVKSNSLVSQTGVMVVDGTVSGIDVSMGDVFVDLYKNATSAQSTGLEGYVLVATMLVGADGSYSFENLPAGVYVVRAVIDNFVSPQSAAINITGGATGGRVDFSVNSETRTVTPGAPVISGVTFCGEILAFDLKLYPNPFTGAVRITGADGAVLHIFNVTGSLVHTQRIENADGVIVLENLPSGLYLFRFEKDGNVRTERVVKD